MVNDEIAGDKGIDPCCISTKCGTRFTQSGQIDDNRHTGKILQNNPNRFERNFDLRLHRRAPVRYRFDVGLAYRVVIEIPQCRFEQHLYGFRISAQMRPALFKGSKGIAENLALFQGEWREYAKQIKRFTHGDIGLDCPDHTPI